MANIAILVPTLKKGGAEKQAALLACALNGIHNVILIIPFPESGLEEELVLLSSLSKEKVIIFKHKGGSKFLLYKALKQNKIDILFCYLTWPDLWGPIIGKVAGVRYIFQGIRNAKLPKAKVILEFIGHLLSTKAISNNYSGSKIFKKKGIRNIEIIPNCYYNPKQITTREAKNTIDIITIGRFVAQKDYHTAIKAVEKAMDKDGKLRFTIVGHGELEEDIRYTVEKSRHRDKIIIMINPHNISGLLDNSDIYISTSRFEGTSNSIMEAMDASLPVIATDVGDNSELVNNNFNGFLVDVGDIDTISKKLGILASDISLRIEMGHRGNQIIREKFGFEKFKNRYLELIGALYQ